MFLLPISTNFCSYSMPITFLPSSAPSINVVPMPAIGSRINSPFFEYLLIISLHMLTCIFAGCLIDSFVYAIRYLSLWFGNFQIYSFMSSPALLNVYSLLAQDISLSYYMRSLRSLMPKFHIRSGFQGHRYLHGTYSEKQPLSLLSFLL